MLAESPVGRRDGVVVDRRGETHHLGQSTGRDDVAGVDETVEMARRFLYRLSHVIVAVEIEHVGDQVKGILVVLDLGVEAREVKAIRKIVFVDLAEVLVAARRDELAGITVSTIK